MAKEKAIKMFAKMNKSNVRLLRRELIVTNAESKIILANKTRGLKLFSSSFKTLFKTVLNLFKNMIKTILETV